MYKIAQETPEKFREIETMHELRKISDLNNRWCFLDDLPRAKGKKVYERGLMFKKILKKTGIKLMPKDLRDYFCNEVAASIRDPAVLMRLMRHRR